MKAKRSFLAGLRDRLGGGSEDVELTPGDRLRLSGKGLRAPCEATPYSIEMGKQTVHVCPDRPLAAGDQHTPTDFIVFDPDLYYSGISHALRLKPGETLAIDHREEHQRQVFAHQRDTFRRHLQITHDGQALIFRDPISELGTYLSIVSEEQEQSRRETRREGFLQRILEIYGGPLEQLPPDIALESLKEVNRLLKKDPYRRQDSLGNAGAVVELPPHLTPIIVGDLHAQVDNLLKILTENAFLDGMQRNEAALILLGDAIHPEAEGKLSDMDSSVLIMDLILRLKQTYPGQVFFVVGNHDSFSPDVMKGGVPQSVLWEKRVRQLRGEAYCQELALFYRQSPLLVISDDFVACHAGPPRSRVSLDTLVEARQFPDLVHQLTWNRIKTKGWPLGYRHSDVKRFRKSLGFDENMPFIVAHYPQSREGTMWLNIDQIPNHHILYSARDEQVGLFTRVGGELVPQIYPAESLLDTINARASS